jgi:hypothetical protein
MTLVPQPNDCFTSIYIVCHRLEAIRRTRRTDGRDPHQGTYFTANRTPNTISSGRPTLQAGAFLFSFRRKLLSRRSLVAFVAVLLYPAFFDKLTWWVFGT